MSCTFQVPQALWWAGHEDPFLASCIRDRNHWDDTSFFASINWETHRQTINKHFADTLRNLGFVPSEAASDVWVREESWILLQIRLFLCRQLCLQLLCMNPCCSLHLMWLMQWSMITDTNSGVLDLPMSYHLLGANIYHEVRPWWNTLLSRQILHPTNND